jgi:hypothetical protein
LSSTPEPNSETSNAPLAPFCSLCGDGYNPTLRISVADEPTEPKDGGRSEYRWCHEQCKRDNDRLLAKAEHAEAEPEDGWKLPPASDSDQTEDTEHHDE